MWNKSQVLYFDACLDGYLQGSKKRDSKLKKFNG